MLLDLVDLNAERQQSGLLALYIPLEPEVSGLNQKFLVWCVGHVFNQAENNNKHSHEWMV